MILETIVKPEDVAWFLRAGWTLVDEESRMITEDGDYCVTREWFEDAVN